jgi:hypothetical protein
VHQWPSVFSLPRSVTVMAVIRVLGQIRVILYAKATFHGAWAPADELPIEDILAVEHDVIPLDGADVFQQGGIDSIGDRVALAEDPGDLPRLPVDDVERYVRPCT